ncbi:hypothetical protein PybrP1_000448 [[Pythium] brassicae (nom. inval.)]|nr:hypothetical protein PybrP1_000448 [[Pythium] brassicae (nom. inval.)]
MLETLLHADGIAVNQPCSLGATAFHAAANAGDLRVRACLSRLLLYPNALVVGSQVTRWWGCFFRQILEMLCAAGALTSVVDANGWTALHYAAACPTGVEAMHFLCELLPDLLDAQCSDGNTALHVAAGYGCVANVRALLQTAANPHVQNRDAHTAYHVALHCNKVPCAVAINEYMANAHELYTTAARLACESDDGNAALLAPVPRCTSVRGAAKADAISAPAVVHQPHHAAELFPNTWIEYSTPDGLPYYYNASTGASSWHKPTSLPLREHQPDIFGRVWADELCAREDAPGSAGQQLPLCLIPMVSLLASLDDPTAAAKIEAKRRRAREKRRASARCPCAPRELTEPTQE